MLKRVSKPRGLFDGENFMTPTVLSYYKLRDGLYAELSKGEGMSRQPIWGVSVQPDRKLSKLFQSVGAAHGYIAELSEGFNE